MQNNQRNVQINHNKISPVLDANTTFNKLTSINVHKFGMFPFFWYGIFFSQFLDMFFELMGVSFWYVQQKLKMSFLFDILSLVTVSLHDMWCV